MESHEEYWDEIPGYAFIALGRRGREQVLLHSCFVPHCINNDRDKLHPLAKTDTFVKADTNDATIRRITFRIHCDVCQQDFHLAFEQVIPLDTLTSSDSTTQGADQGILYEQVFATDALDRQNYGHIGFVQSESRG